MAAPARDLVLLSAHDEAVWADVRGGLSSLAAVHTPSLDDHDTLPDLATAVLAEAPPRFALAGLCVGGYVALEILARAPERVTRLALLHTSARADSTTEAERRARRIDSLRAKDGGEHPSALYARETLLWMAAPASLRDPAVADRIEAVLRATPIAAAARQQAAMASRRDRRDDLAGLRLPTLIVAGAVDRISPPALSREMAALIPGARLEVLAGCGHLSPIEQPEILSALLRDWLTDAAPAQAAG
jgi:pimeloyl-ACP methyl ester carboxylesterase